MYRGAVMGAAQVESLTPTPRHPLKRGGGGWDTNRYLVPGLSFEGGIFNEQQTTFVPICTHGPCKTLLPIFQIHAGVTQNSMLSKKKGQTEKKSS